MPLRSVIKTEKAPRGGAGNLMSLQMVIKGFLLGTEFKLQTFTKAFIVLEVRSPRSTCGQG